MLGSSWSSEKGMKALAVIGSTFFAPSRASPLILHIQGEYKPLLLMPVQPVFLGEAFQLVNNNLPCIREKMLVHEKMLTSYYYYTDCCC